MIAAFPIWNGRLAPVFDSAELLHLVRTQHGEIVDTDTIELHCDFPFQQILQLTENGVNTLVCGAISRPFGNALLAHGIEVIPFITGEVETVIKAWLEGRLESAEFMMPGCGRMGRGRRQHRGPRHGMPGGMRRGLREAGFDADFIDQPCFRAGRRLTRGE